MNLEIQPGTLNSDPDDIARNVFSRISILETFSLLFLFSLILVFTYHHHKGFYLPWDFEKSFMLAGRGDFSNFFYGYWITPIFWILEKIPHTISFILWSATNVVCTFIASRVFGGKSWLTIFSYQMMYMVFYGQITGIIIGGLALAWWGIITKKYYLAGLGFLISFTKPQLGLVIGFILWITSDLSWKEKFKILIIPVIGFVITTIIFPNWIYNIFAVINSGKVDRTGSISLWRYIGPWSMLFLVPPIFLKSSSNKQSLFLIVASLISLPYLQNTGLLALYVFPFGLLSLLGNLGFLFPLLGWGVIRWLFVVPLLIYAVILFQEIRYYFIYRR